MTEHGRSAVAFWTSRSGLVFAGFLGVALFFLVTEHLAHLYGALPYLLVAAMLGMHLLHGGRHAPRTGGGAHGNRQAAGPGRAAPRAADEEVRGGGR